MSEVRISYLAKILHPDVIPRLSKIAVASKYAHCDLTKLNHIFVADVDGNPVGFAGLACYHGNWCLRVCVVAKKYRGQGIQRKLIRERMQFIEDRGVKHLNAWASPKNTYSLNNLIALGFRFVDEPPQVYNGIECFKLRRKL